MRNQKSQNLRKKLLAMIGLVMVVCLVEYCMYALPSITYNSKPVLSYFQSPVTTQPETETSALVPCNLIPATAITFMVEPVTSPTNELKQVITVNWGEVTIITEAGTFYFNSDDVKEIPLLPNTANHIEVVAEGIAKDERCAYNGYTLRAVVDRTGAPLTIIQGEPVTGKAQNLITAGNASQLKELTSFSPDAGFVNDFILSNAELVSVGDDSKVSIWSLESGKETRQIDMSKISALVVAMNSDQSFIATGGTVYSPVVRLWNKATGAWTQLGNHQSYLMSLGFNPSGVRLASGGDDNSVMIWDVNSSKLLLTLTGDSRKFIYSLAWVDEDTIVAGGTESILWWDTKTGNLLKRVPRPKLDKPSFFFVDAAFSQNGNRVAAAAQDSNVYFWDAAVEKWTVWAATPDSSIAKVSFSPDGRLLVAGTNKGLLLIWDVETQQLVAQFQTTNNEIAAIRFSPNGYYLAFGGWKGPIRVWGIP